MLICVRGNCLVRTNSKFWISAVFRRTVCHQNAPRSGEKCARKSVVLSALSVLYPLAELALVSEEASHDEILQTIGLPNDEVMKKVLKDISEKLSSVQDVELKLGNRVYVRKGAEANQIFMDDLNQYFKFAKNVDFKLSDAAAKDVNTWAADNPNNPMTDLMDQKSFSSTTQAVLMNTISFKGEWVQPFRVENTRDRDFYIQKWVSTPIPTMFKTDFLNYGTSVELDAKLLELPYKSGESSLLIVLPNEKDGINSLVDKLKVPCTLNKAIDDMYYTNVHVYLPKFKIETTTDLAVVLNKMGLQRLFIPGEANLSQLLKSTTDLFVREAVQKTHINVNEKGTDGETVNEFEPRGRICVQSARNALSFKADHPFAFFLKVKNNIIFTGHFLS